ncbi:hypothetical protein M758_2G071300 [Ceratodon purpureus]|nr:hypothetical protein M758_2G071300 [Ceratodon purpureus]
MKGLEPGTSPLHVLLRHRLGRTKPNCAGTWPPSLQWPLLKKFSAPRSAGVWQRVLQAWRQMSPLVEALPPVNYDEVLNSSLWWTTHYFGHNFGASITRASFLARKGLTQVADIWDPEHLALLPWEAIRRKYQLPAADQPIFELMQRHFPASWTRLCHTTRYQALPDEWLGLFDPGQLDTPSLVFLTSKAFTPALTTVTDLELHDSITVFKLGPIACTLAATPKPPRVSGILRRIRVVVTNLKPSQSRKQAKSGVARYLAPVDMLSFDLGRWHWPVGARLHAYTAKLGRKVFRPRTELTFPIQDKWRQDWPIGHTIHWKEIWHKDRSMKEAGFLWSLVHRAVAVNMWRHQSNQHASEQCLCCDDGEVETFRHCFFSCPGARHAWDYSTSVLYRVARLAHWPQPWPRLTWAQCLLGTALPSYLQPFQHLWSLLRGSTLWVIWIHRNAQVFSATRWTVPAIEIALWETFLDLARTAWYKMEYMQEHNATGLGNAIEEFQATWLTSTVFCTGEDERIRWNFRRPPGGTFFD